MEIHALASTLQKKYRSLTPQQKPIAIFIASLVSLAILFLIIHGCKAIFHHKPPNHIPMILRQGNTLIIPTHSPLRSRLTIGTVNSTKAPHSISFPGMVEINPLNSVNLLPPLAGRLIQIHVKLGDFVKRHQIVATIKSPGLALAYADQDKAKSMLTLSKEALDRVIHVNQVGGNAKKDIELAQSNYLQALAEFKRATATIKTFGKNTFSKLNIKAPMDGTITAINYGRGSFINDVTSPLMTVSNIKTVYVTAQIPENYIHAITKNLAVTIQLPALPHEILHGHVDSINPLIEVDSRRSKTRILVKNPNNKLMPNMFANVNIAIPIEKQCLIPLSAILMNNDTTSVFLETKPWVFVRRNIKLGQEDGDNVRVASGLRMGDRIVMQGGVLVND